MQNTWGSKPTYQFASYQWNYLIPNFLASIKVTLFWLKEFSGRKKMKFKPSLVTFYCIHFISHFYADRHSTKCVVKFLNLGTFINANPSIFLSKSKSFILGNDKLWDCIGDFIRLREVIRRSSLQDYYSVMLRVLGIGPIQ